MSTEDFQVLVGIAAILDVICVCWIIFRSRPAVLGTGIRLALYRLVALAIDQLLCFLTIVVPGLAFLMVVGSTTQTQIQQYVGVLVLIWLVATWLYFALMESSVRQATVGKRTMGLIVTDLSGRRISFGKATCRFLGRFFAWFPAGFGYLTLIFSEKRQGIHDMLAGTLVVTKGQCP